MFFLFVFFSLKKLTSAVQRWTVENKQINKQIIMKYSLSLFLCLFLPLPLSSISLFVRMNERMSV